MVAEQLKHIRDDKYWTENAMFWQIPTRILRRAAVSSPESVRVKVGDYDSFAKLIVKEDGTLQMRICVDHPRFTKMRIDHLSVQLQGDRGLLRMWKEQVMEKEDGEEDVDGAGGDLTISECDEEGRSTKRGCTLEDLISEVRDGCVTLYVGFRLKEPDLFRVGCQE